MVGVGVCGLAPACERTERMHAKKHVDVTAASASRHLGGRHRRPNRAMLLAAALLVATTATVAPAAGLCATLGCQVHKVDAHSCQVRASTCPRFIPARLAS